MTGDTPVEETEEERRAREQVAENFRPGAGGAAGREVSAPGATTAPALETSTEKLPLSAGSESQPGFEPTTAPRSTSLGSQAAGEAKAATGSGAVPEAEPDWVEESAGLFGKTGGGVGAGSGRLRPSKETIEVEGALAPPSPEALAALGEGFQLEQIGETQKAAAQAGASRAIAGLNKQKEDFNKKFADEEARQAGIREGVVGRYRTALEGITKDIAEQKSKLDPRRLWHDKNFGEKILHFFAAVFSGGLAGAQGGENQYLKRYDAMERADYEKQLDKLGATERGAERTQNALGAFMKLTGDLQAARAALSASKLAAIEAAIQQQLRGKEATAEGANLVAVLGKIKQRQAQEVIKYEQAMQGKTKRTLELKAAPAGGGGGGAEKSDMPTWMREDFKNIQDRLDKSGVNELEDIFGSTLEALKMPRDLASRTSALIRKGEYSRAGDELAAYMQKNPQAQQNWDLARVQFRHRVSGAAIPVGEKAPIEAALNDASPYGIRVFGHNLGEAIKRRRADAYGAVDRKSAAAFELNRRYFARRARPPEGTPAPVPASK